MDGREHYNGDNDDNRSCNSSACSVDTEEAFLEMLGLSSMTAAIEDGDGDGDGGGICVISMADAGADDDSTLKKKDWNCSKCSDGGCDDTLLTSASSSESKSREEDEVEDGKRSFGHKPVSQMRVPPRCSRYLHRPSDVAAFVIDDLLNELECLELISLAESSGGACSSKSSSFHYVTEAAHTDDRGVVHVVKLQEANKHKLSVFEHPPTIDKLWRKMQPVIEPHITTFVRNVGCGPPKGLNPRLRVLCYDADDHDVFEPHFDATTRVGHRTSLLTVLIYLNDGDGKDFDGGETCYMDHHVSASKKLEESETRIQVTPRTGRAVVFEHDLFHSSAPLKYGTKYVLRTDICFELPAGQGGLGVDKPRRGPGSANNQNDRLGFTADDACCTTLMEVCQQIRLSEEAKLALDGIGLLDLTLDSLFAPGLLAVKHMMHDALDQQSADLLLQAAIASR